MTKSSVWKGNSANYLSIPTNRIYDQGPKRSQENTTGKQQPLEVFEQPNCQCYCIARHSLTWCWGPDGGWESGVHPWGLGSVFTSGLLDILISYTWPDYSVRDLLIT